MHAIRTAAQVRDLDERLIETMGIPGRVLMEVAGREAAVEIHKRWPTASVAVLCGPGNNGGDGFVVARWLHTWGHDVRIWSSRPPSTDAARANQQVCEKIGLHATPLTRAIAGAGVVVDALLGTGQRSAPGGTVLEGVVAARIVADAGIPVVALDLPTGVHADTGQPLGSADEAVAATLTVTFGAWKPGLLCMPGAALAGDVHVVDLGFELGLGTTEAPPKARLMDRAHALKLMPRREPGEAKWNRGHVAVMGGGGAAILACHGALRAGAGLVSLAVPRGRWPELHGLWPEVILMEPAHLNPRRHDVLVMGPGLGKDGARIVRDLWSRWPGPVVADADALSILAEETTVPVGNQPRVITPHSAEAARLLKSRRSTVEADRWTALHELRAFGSVVLKGPHTLVGPSGAADPEQPPPCPWVSPVADGRLATAGSGDVLAGLIGGFLALKLRPQEAAGLGVWLHGAAAEHMPEDGSASDLLDGMRAARAALSGADQGASLRKSAY